MDLWQWYINNDVNVGDYCHITGKYKGSAQREFLLYFDSLQFLSSSLDSLIKNLNNDNLNIWVKNLIITN